MRRDGTKYALSLSSGGAVGLSLHYEYDEGDSESE
jgi:hypothetical protein